LLCGWNSNVNDLSLPSCPKGFNWSAGAAGWGHFLLATERKPGGSYDDDPTGTPASAAPVYGLGQNDDGQCFPDIACRHAVPDGWLCIQARMSPVLSVLATHARACV
jgi:hypothetical protein